MKKTTVRINEIIKRLAAKGIQYHMQGQNVIECRTSDVDGVTRETTLHCSTTSIEQAASDQAHRVLRDGERLADRWSK